MGEARSNRGGARPNSGRKSKSEEQKLIEKLSPMEDIAHAKLKEALSDGEQWAVKLYFEYMYGKPKQQISHSGDLNVIPEANITFNSKGLAPDVK